MPTLIDVAKRKDPDGKPAKVAEMLTQTNEVLNDIGWDEGNLPAGHRVTQRTGLPTVYYRLLNQGVAEVEEHHGADRRSSAPSSKARSEIDVKVADFGGNAAAFRRRSRTPFLEAMNQQFASTLIYGNRREPEQFTGLALRYSSTAAGNGRTSSSAGGSGSDNTSIYLVVWGPEQHLRHLPEGLEGRPDCTRISASATRSIRRTTGSAPYMERWQWKGGIAMKDWRYVVRIANIDISTSSPTTRATVKLAEYMAKAIDRVPSLNMGRPVFYCNRTVVSMLRARPR
jgi:hypothetical protein